MFSSIGSLKSTTSCTILQVHKCLKTKHSKLTKKLWSNISMSPTRGLHIISGVRLDYLPSKRVQRNRNWTGKELLKSSSSTLLALITNDVTLIPNRTGTCTLLVFPWGAAYIAKFISTSANRINRHLEQREKKTPRCTFRKKLVITSHCRWTSHLCFHGTKIKLSLKLTWAQ